MARRFAPLTQHQVEVLRWINDGCPAGVWDDFRYKHTAYALANRKLVTVDRRRHSWTATCTEAGHYYLEHGAYREDANPSLPSRRRPSGAPKTSPAEPADEISSQDLLDELQTQGGSLTVVDPSASIRASYRRALSRALADQLVPEGFALRYTGRDRGDLVIRLIDRAAEPPAPEPLPTIEVPESVEGCAGVVRMLRTQSSRLDVSDELHDRALRLVQALASECERRGYELSLPDDPDVSFQITVEAEHEFTFTLAEELERREVLTDEGLAAAKYDWQRVPAVVRNVRSSRLILRLGTGYGSSFWADRKRWTLDQKLPEVLQEVAKRAEARATALRKAEADRLERRRQWDEAVPRARKAYIDQVNRERLGEQVDQATEAERIRAYCIRIQALVATTDSAEAAHQMRQWIAWAQREADRLDPLKQPERLRYVVPEDISPADFNSFMPRGMSAWSPPQ